MRIQRLLLAAAAAVAAASTVSANTDCDVREKHHGHQGNHNKQTTTLEIDSLSASASADEIETNLTPVAVDSSLTGSLDFDGDFGGDFDTSDSEDGTTSAEADSQGDDADVNVDPLSSTSASADSASYAEETDASFDVDASADSANSEPYADTSVDASAASASTANEADSSFDFELDSTADSAADSASAVDDASSNIVENSSNEIDSSFNFEVESTADSATASASAVDDASSSVVEDSTSSEADDESGVSSGSDTTTASTSVEETTPFTATAPPVATTATPTTMAATSSNATSTSTSSSSGACSKPTVTITEVDIGVSYEASEDEATLKVVAIAAKPSGGSLVAVQSGDFVYVYELDSSDKLASTTEVAKVPAVDFADLYADDDGFVLLATRDAEGGGTLNCGNPSNLCSAPSDAVPCYDMYLIRYDAATESWATKLTSSSASLPPYSTAATGNEVYMIWWYAHHGRIAFDGTNWASYFGCALSVSESSCINIHQGDRMKVVGPTGSVLSDHNSFDWGCSHSGYERITYDNRSESFAMICKTDSNNRIMPPDNWDVTIYPVDLAASNLGDIVMDGSSSSGGYWATVSNSDSEDAAVHLIHFTLSAEADKDITLKGGKANERAPHLARIGSSSLLAMWEGSSASGDLVEGSSDRTIFIQTLDASTGEAISDVITVDSSVVGNRYQALKTYPDGSVAYLSKGTTDTSLQVVRFSGC